VAAAEVAGALRVRRVNVEAVVAPTGTARREQSRKVIRMWAFVVGALHQPALVVCLARGKGARDGKLAGLLIAIKELEKGAI
jgi:hypothetical protein